MDNPGQGDGQVHRKENHKHRCQNRPQSKSRKESQDGCQKSGERNEEDVHIQFLR